MKLLLPLLLLTIHLSFLSPANADVLTVLPNRFKDLENKLGQANDGDTILIPPGTYIGKDKGEWTNPKNICDMVSTNSNNSKPNLIIRGTGNDPEKIKLVGIVIQYCDFFLILENLSTYFCDSAESAIEDDMDKGIILRNVIVNTPYTSRYGIHMMSMRIGIINSEIKAYPPLSGVGNIGLKVENGGVTMINSKVEGYKYGVVLSGIDGYYTTDVNWKVYSTKWNVNTKGCSTNTGSFVSCTQALSQITPNTPASNSPKDVNQFIDILRYNSWPPSSAGPHIPVVVNFPNVKKKGETTIYRLPSAYPEPPSSVFISAVNPQYFQFDCTAKLGKKAILKFNKTAIDSEFNSNANIKVYTFKSGGWVLVPSVVQGNAYTFTYPKKQLRGLVAFFEIR